MPQSTREILGDATLLDVCLSLHMGNNGSGDPWSFDRKKDVEMLEMALRDWEKSPDFTLEFDEAVRNLIVVSLTENKRYGE